MRQFLRFATVGMTNTARDARRRTPWHCGWRCPTYRPVRWPTDWAPRTGSCSTARGRSGSVGGPIRYCVVAVVRSPADALLLRAAVGMSVPRELAQVAVAAPVTLVTFALSRAGRSPPMSRRLRLLLAFAALVALSVAALVAYDPTDPPQTAAAATDCVASRERTGSATRCCTSRPSRRSGSCSPSTAPAGRATASPAAPASPTPPTATASPCSTRAPPRTSSGASTTRWARPTSTTCARCSPRRLALACTDRVFATGVSNGGGFAARVGCELDDVVAIAPVAGGYRALDRCPSTARVPPSSRSTAPPTTSSPTAARSPTTPARSRATSPAGRSRDGCAGKPTSRRETKVVTHLRYARCANGLAVEHLRLADVDHGWPEKAWGLDTNTAVLSSSSPVY